MAMALFYRATRPCSALGEPRVLMRIALVGTVLHGLLAWLLVGGGAGLPALGGGLRVVQRGGELVRACLRLVFA